MGEQKTKEFRATVRKNSNNGQMTVTIPKSVHHLFSPGCGYDWSADPVEERVE